jgi:D-threo-aldose 1-dehydrogenase
VIPGALSPAEVDANAAHLRRSIPAALWQDLRHEGLIDPAAPVPAALG